MSGFNAYSNLFVSQENGQFGAHIFGHMLIVGGVQVVQQANDDGRISTYLWPIALEEWQTRFNEIGNVVAQLFALLWNDSNIIIT